MVIATFQPVCFLAKSNVLIISKWYSVHLLSFLWLLFSVQSVTALDQFSIEIAQIESKDWQLNGMKLALSNLQKKNQILSSSINQLVLPEPFSTIKLLDIQCTQFNWQENQIGCQQGQAKFNHKQLSPTEFNFSFSISENNSQFKITKFKFAQGILNLTAKQQGQQWFVTMTSQEIELPKIQNLLVDYIDGLDGVSSGQLNAKVQLSGTNDQLKKLSVESLLKQISLQAKQDAIATELLDLQLNLYAKKNKGLWQWQQTAKVTQGEFYIDPVYINIEDKVLQFNTQGVKQQSQILINHFEVLHSDIAELSAKGSINYRASHLIEQAEIRLNVLNFDHFSRHYVSPFLDQTAFQSITFKGQLESELSIKQSTINQMSGHYKNLFISDEKQRIKMDGGEGVFNWSNDSDFITPSRISWQQLKIKKIPIDAGKLELLFNNDQISLLSPSRIPMLDGEVTIKRFNWQKQSDSDPKVFFEGEINNISLEHLSNALDWTPLSGQLSGYIPGVDYQNKTLSTHGELSIQLFDGSIKINKLSSSGLLTDFASLQMDVTIDNLDLHSLTQKFEIGHMEGRISGFINNLSLENWQPVTFYGWLGTPEDDDSRHRISQKAVENIASIGGGGAADVISKGFLSFFDSFGYQKLGFGCYLHQGVCQLLGVEAAEKGYYIVKGGGIPRIDVVGYNPQVDWNVLMQRLSRVFTSNEVIIE